MMPLEREQTLCRMSRALARVQVLDDMLARYAAYVQAGISDDDIIELDGKARRNAEIYRTHIAPLAKATGRENRTGT